MLDKLLEFNEEFDKNKDYEKFISNKFPNKKIAILTCMDTRLTELLPAALGLKNGDVKMIKNAGAVITSPFGSVMRSLVVAIYELDVEEILVIGHHDCGMKNIDCDKVLSKMKERNISDEKINLLSYCGVDFKSWLKGFDSVEESIKSTVDYINNHPLVPNDVKVHGLIMNPHTGKVELV